MKRTLLLWLVSVAAATAPSTLVAQLVNFESDMPRVMVFLEEDGVTAATILTQFLSEAGFEVIDPAFAKTVAQRERANRAMAGDEAEAVELGRDLGAQILLIGRAPTDAAPNPVEPTLMIGTAELQVRALRLDNPRIVATASTRGRAPEATAGGARTAALRGAAEDLLYSSSFLGNVLIDWEERRWDNTAYWAPDPGSLQGQLAGSAASQARQNNTGAGGGASSAAAPSTGSGPAAGGPGVAIVHSDIYPDTLGGTRGIAVQSKSDAKSRPDRSVTSRARVRGVVTGGATTVTVGNRPATIRAVTPEEMLRFGMQGGSDTGIFEADVTMESSQDTLRVVAMGPGNSRTEALIRPRIGRRWAVIIGIDEYQDRRIAQLEYAVADARAMHDFLRSDAGGAVPDEQIRLLLNEDATFANLREALFVFLQQAAPEDLVVVYLASHGAPDPERPGNLYIMTHDTNLDRMAATGFPMWDFKTALRRQIGSERTVVIADACHSGGALSGAENPIAGAFAEVFSPSRRVMLTAANVHEFSFEGPQFGGGHGAFTHELIQGLRGKADRDGDRVVTFSEVAAYVQGQVALLTDSQQNPQRVGLGDVPLGYLPPR